MVLFFYYYISPEGSYTQLHWYSASSCCHVVWDVYIEPVLGGVQDGGNVAQDVVIPPGIISLVQGHLAVIE